MYIIDVRLRRQDFIKNKKSSRVNSAIFIVLIAYIHSIVTTSCTKAFKVGMSKPFGKILISMIVFRSSCGRLRAVKIDSSAKGTHKKVYMLIQDATPCGRHHGMPIFLQPIQCKQRLGVDRRSPIN